MKQGFSESFNDRWNRIEGVKRRIVTVLNNADEEFNPRSIYKLLTEMKDEISTINDKFVTKYLKYTSYEQPSGECIKKPDDL